jgi:hypothetical protein
MHKGHHKKGNKKSQREEPPFTSKFTSCCAACDSCAKDRATESRFEFICKDPSDLNLCGTDSLALIASYSESLDSPKCALQCSQGSTETLRLACGLCCRCLMEALHDFNDLSGKRSMVRNGVVPLTAGTADTECSPADSNSMVVVIDPLPAPSTYSTLRFASEFQAYTPE